MARFMGYDLETETWFEPNEVVFIELDEDEIKEMNDEGDAARHWKCPTVLPSNRDMFEVTSSTGDILYIEKEEFDAERLFYLLERGYDKIDHLDKLQYQSRDVLEVLLGAYIQRKDSLQAQLHLNSNHL